MIRIGLLITVALVLLMSGCKNAKNKAPQPKDTTQEWVTLLDENLSHWEPFLGIPHKSSNIVGYEEVEDVKVGTPLGLSNQNNVFSVIKEQDELVLKVTGEIFGSLMSKNEFENYHLKLQVKWGEKRWEPRLKALHNNGLLYHSVGKPGTGLWNTWMSSLEFEIENTNFGDFITINDAHVKAKCPSEKTDSKYYFNADGPLHDFCWDKFETGRCFKSENHEKPFGEWTSLELICFGDIALHIVEGKVVNAVYQAKFFDGNQWVDMKKGRLQIQSEAAETYFKDIKIKSLSQLQPQYKKYIRNN